MRGFDLRKFKEQHVKLKWERKMSGTTEISSLVNKRLA